MTLLLLLLVLVFPVASAIGLILHDKYKTRCFLRSHYWCARCASFKDCKTKRFVKTPYFI